ncbi:MAG: protein kinase, partial [Planctomycetaceae bacterium]|nr:protein kinase [Planctomycetaceae bacterium]
MKAVSCNSHTIDDFLADRLSADQQAAFETHLNHCDSCCAELQKRTADAVLWHEARALLSSADEMERLPAQSDCDPSTRSLAAERDGTALNLDFLNPTDDPRMLGRFAGYEISGVIGCGGMGVVLKGFDASLNRYAAIKVLAPHYATSGAARQRFAREAQAAAAVVHDNVIAIHGVSEFNHLPYLIMPYVKGQSLQKRIDQHGPLSVAEILRIAMQTARGLAAAHDQGLVHRDIKPANILLPENVERVLITDFGLARAADDASLTRSGVIAGTPQYMSPEQAKGEGIDHRSDLFSLGSVMYTMATGHPPFRAETPYGILRRITDNA